ncbi:MAG: glycosyltransferase family 2 protein [Pseudomonadota bacterium]|nr:glycosyltransferase family 2 protein [Pseudomonadota bacterium]
MTAPLVTVVVPARNEAGNIAPLVARLRDFFADAAIIVVDDASTDGTVKELESMDVRVLVHDRRSGQSAAVRTGVLAASTEYVATLDGDGQNDPADLPRMLEILTGDNPPGMVIGHRVERRDTRWRLWVSKIAGGIRARILKDNAPDSACGIKMLRRDIYLRLPWFDHNHRFMPALVRREGLDVVFMPVSHAPRVFGRSKYGTFGRALAGIVDLMGVWWLVCRAPRPKVDERS